MAYNTTTWTTDPNTKADANTTNSKFHIYRSLVIGTAVPSDLTTEQYLPLASGSSTSAYIYPQYQTRFTWATGGNLVKGYLVAEEWNPNATVGTANIITFKVYRYRPDGSTNTGTIKTVGNWTLLDTVNIPNLNLQAKERGIEFDFTEEDCSFSKGDLMSISIDNSVDVEVSNDSSNFVFVLKEDWNDIISSNV